VEQNAHLIRDLETALTGLARLIKALRFYPPEHPSLKAAIGNTRGSFQPFLAHPPKAFNVSQNGFSVEQQTVADGSSILLDLARQLVARRTRQLLILPEVTEQELLAFAHLLSISADDVYRQGGLPLLMEQARIANIWLNEPSLEQAQKKRDELQEKIETGQMDAPTEPAPEAAKTTQTKSVRAEVADILKQLRAPLEDREHALLLARLQELAPEFFAQTGVNGAMHVLPMLRQHYRDELRSTEQQQAADRTLTQLLNERLVFELVDALSSNKLPKPHLKQIAALLIKLEIRVAPYLLKRLSQEENAQTRRNLTLILGQMGGPILDLLQESLTDSRWFVVRNTVSVLGDMRQKAALPLLKPVLKHQDVRVKRTLIRALAMIGGGEAVPLLLKLVSDKNLTLRRPAILALGALKREEAVSPLLKIVTHLDILGRDTGIKLDAIRALAIIGSTSAVPTLLNLAKRPNLLRRASLEAQRVAALSALGQLGTPDLTPTLERLKDGRRGEINRAAEQALTQIQRRNNVTKPA